ncbi:MAG: hypothetical protein EP330_26685 [Deltaproteobacteria bacterium]|nr:MAG: hypothetical protein EP330_26685 [Deltaproteobacteria bacterium]
MNDDLRSMLRDAVVALATLTVLCGLFGGGELALGTFVSGLAAIGNFALLGYLIALSTRASTVGRGGAVAGLLMFKIVAMLALVLGLVSYFGTVAPAIGAGSVVLALSVRGMLDALHVSDDELPEGVA